MIYDAEFWGMQGRIGLAKAGALADCYIFVYPDTRDGWWVLVVDPSPVPGLPGDSYIDDEEWLRSELDDAEVGWVPAGPEEERLERCHFGWRPLK